MIWFFFSAVECGPPLPIPNAESFQNQIYFYGDKIVYRCLPGYQKYGDVSIRCEAEARWSRIQGRCISKHFFGLKSVFGIYLIS